MGAATAVALLAGIVVAPGGASAAAAKRIPVVSVHAGKTLSLSRTHLSPGRVTFDVQSAKGESDLQIASLRNGYTFAQANQDVNAAFGGNLAAIRRADANISFKGGVAATPKHPASFTVYLSAGTYYATVNNLFKKITVSGAAVNRKTVKTNSTVTMLTYGFDSLPRLPRSGEMRLSNGAEQPHFLVLIHVKKNTTRAMLKQAFSSESQSAPNFVLSGGTSTGILSPGKTQAFSYSTAAGRYVLACFWADDVTGMSHAAMGMYKLVTLY
ncbi:hypothetical protein [uncultured Jatrophihabitans sp.]|uniref:hypothetical protein n=1 Tax=uncultured Jatrophihabitans sp. TaxID=1610747 RepID=UPI0035CA6FE4